jgi:hypothetical protein
MNTTVPLPRAGAILNAQLFRDIDVDVEVDGDVPGLSPFVMDEHDDFWSICTGFHESIIPVQRHSSDGWIAAIFHRGYGYIKIVAPGEILPLPRNQTVVARVHRQGVRWEFANPPG